MINITRCEATQTSSSIHTHLANATDSSENNERINLWVVSFKAENRIFDTIRTKLVSNKNGSKLIIFQRFALQREKKVADSMNQLEQIYYYWFELQWKCAVSCSRWVTSFDTWAEWEWNPFMIFTHQFNWH